MESRGVDGALTTAILTLYSPTAKIANFRPKTTEISLTFEALERPLCVRNCHSKGTMSKNSTSKRMGRSSGSNFDCLRFENSTVLLWCAARVLAIAPDISYYYQQLQTEASHPPMEGQVCNCWWNKRCLIILWAPPRSHQDLQIEQLATKS